MERGKIKAIFFDIDGTLVSCNTHSIPKSTIYALDQARKQGVKLYIATGRSKSAINNLEGYDFDGYITMNGSICYNAEGEVLYSKSLLHTDVLQITEILKRKSNIACFIIGEKETFIVNRTKQVDDFTRLLNFPEYPDMNVNDIPNMKVYQITPFFTHEDEKLYMPFLENCVGGRWHTDFLDISRKGNTKALGIDHIIEHYDIALDECMAFGDGGNDLDMVKHAGIGVAMGNAIDKLKEVSDYVTDSVDDDGILNALKHYNVID